MSTEMISNTSPQPRLLYSRKDAAYQLSLSVRGLDYLIAERRLHTRKIGGRILISHEELLRFIRHDRLEPMTSSDTDDTVDDEAAA